MRASCVTQQRLSLHAVHESPQRFIDSRMEHTAPGVRACTNDTDRDCYVCPCSERSQRRNASSALLVFAYIATTTCTQSCACCTAAATTAVPLSSEPLLLCTVCLYYMATVCSVCTFTLPLPALLALLLLLPQHQ
eukprot:14713-Heterococcus_DN1.PRE.1